MLAEHGFVLLEHEKEPPSFSALRRAVDLYFTTKPTARLPALRRNWRDTWQPLHTSEMRVTRKVYAEQKSLKSLPVFGTDSDWAAKLNTIVRCRSSLPNFIYSTGLTARQLGTSCSAFLKADEGVTVNSSFSYATQCQPHMSSVGAPGIFDGTVFVNNYRMVRCPHRKWMVVIGN
jgi:hypothetical protein